MKLSSSNSSQFRYFLAGIKPLGRFMFWGPLSLVGLLSLAVWQYSIHPQWLGQVVEQPKTLEDTLVEEQNNTPQPEAAPSVQPSLKQQPLKGKKENNPSLIGDPNLVSPLNTNSSSNNNTTDSSSQKPNTSQLFQPLLPTVKSDTSAFTQRIEPVKVAPITQGSYLQKALEKQYQGQSNPSSYNVTPSESSQSLPQENSNTQSSFPQSIPSQSTNNYPQPYQSPVNVYQPPYNNSSVQPQPSNPYQPPYSSNTYNSYPPSNTYNTQSNPNPQTYYTPPRTQIQPSVNR